MKMVALIPARAGSKRIPGKNTKRLAGLPLIDWTFMAAHQSHVFSRIYVCTDDPGLLQTYAELAIERETVRDAEPDIEWVRRCLPSDCDAFAILRPTSPFRTADTIKRAYELFTNGRYSSIRAVEPVTQHPGKMWLMGAPMTPLIRDEFPARDREVGLRSPDLPFHSQPTQSLPKVYIQNSSLEMAWRWCVDVFETISGPKVGAFLTEGYEGFSIDYPDDWDRAEALAPSLLGGVSPTPAAQ